MEWITILNPNSGQDAQVKISFNFVGDQKSHTLSVPAERVSTVDLFHLPIFPKNKLAGVIIESNVPVIVQQVRRAYQKDVPAVTSISASLPHPIGDQKVE
ncbi:MAG: sensory rhodopsin transducer [Acidobacteria bacterium]|nr:sensory rhodopsin transducer [Acidobacteriota bacterium]